MADSPQTIVTASSCFRCLRGLDLALEIALLQQDETLGPTAPEGHSFLTDETGRIITDESGQLIYI